MLLINSNKLVTNQEIVLPVLDNFLARYPHLLDTLPLKNTLIVYIHHALQTSLNVLTGLERLGANPSNIYVLGKSYSENKHVVSMIKEKGINYQPCSLQVAFGQYQKNFINDIHQLWRLVQQGLSATINDILILDHGGHAVTHIPSEIKDNYPVLGIEKTTAGTFQYTKTNKPNIPLINVASSAAKRWLESPLIAQAITKKIRPTIDAIPNDSLCAVIGFGAIGQAVYTLLKEQGKSVITYDKQSAIAGLATLDDTLQQATYIFGCTGTDFTQDVADAMLTSQTDKVFLSCSSEDKEFLSLLTLITSTFSFNEHDVFADIHYRTVNGGLLTILKGGFPVNFDGSGESVPADDIQLTRTLVMSGVIQAIEMRAHSLSNDLYGLDAEKQQTIIALWNKTKLSPCSNSLRFNDINWINRESVGKMLA